MPYTPKSEDFWSFWKKFLGLTTNDHVDKNSDQEEYEEEEYYENEENAELMDDQSVNENESEEEGEVEYEPDDQSSVTKEDLFVVQNEVHTAIYLLYMLFILEGVWFVSTLIQ